MVGVVGIEDHGEPVSPEWPTVETPDLAFPVEGGTELRRWDRANHGARPFGWRRTVAGGHRDQRHEQRSTPTHVETMLVHVAWRPSEDDALHARIKPNNDVGSQPTARERRGKSQKHPRGDLRGTAPVLDPTGYQGATISLGGPKCCIGIQQFPSKSFLIGSPDFVGGEMMV